MPILWRYLFIHYFRVLLLSLSSFISFLLVMRFKEIAQFASSGASFATVSLFTLYQIPYILPIALPVSCLIASLLLLQKMSHSYELTALRAAGLGLKPLATPLIIAGAVMALLNFSVVSEITPRCRGLSKELVYQQTLLNPLFIAQKESLVRLKDSYFDIKTLVPGKSAKDLLLVINHRTSGRLALLTAKKIVLDNDLLKGDQVSLISSADSKKSDAFDHLIIENQKKMSTKAALLAHYVIALEGKINYDYMPLRLILAKNRLEKKHSTLLFSSKASVEIIRRISFSLAAFTFTFIGTAFGMEIGRDRKKRGIFLAIILSAFCFICFLTAKSMRHSPSLSVIIYLLPHPIAILSSWLFMKRISHGVE